MVSDEMIRQKERELAELKRYKEKENQPVTKKDVQDIIKETIRQTQQQKPIQPPAYKEQKPKKKVLSFNMSKNIDNHKKKTSQEIYKQVPLKTCAVEVVKHLQIFRLFIMGAMGSLFCVLITSSFSLLAGSICVLILFFVATFYFIRVRNELNRLTIEYGL